jgi:DNA-binding Lrp family transcriptional regulator
MWSKVTELPEVRAAFYVGGDDDILLHVCVRDTAHLRDLVMDELPALGAIGRMRTEIVFDHVEQDLPIYVDTSTPPATKKAQR